MSSRGACYTGCCTRRRSACYIRRTRRACCVCLSRGRFIRTMSARTRNCPVALCGLIRACYYSTPCSYRISGLCNYRFSGPCARLCKCIGNFYGLRALRLFSRLFYSLSRLPILRLLPCNTGHLRTCRLGFRTLRRNRGDSSYAVALTRR